MKQYAAFTTQQATTLMSAAKKINGISTGPSVANGLAGTYSMKVFNDSVEAVPPFGCIMLNGYKSVEGMTYLNGIKPTSTHGYFVVNGPAEIPSKSIGTIPCGLQKRFLSTDVDLLPDPFTENGVGYGPRENEWYLQKGGTLITAWGTDESTDHKDIMLGVINETEAIIVKTPATGIPPLVSDESDGHVAGEAQCVPYRIEISGAMERFVEVRTNDDQGQSLAVLNASTTSVDGDTFIVAVVVNGYLTAMSSAGGGGGNDTAKTYQFKTTTAISAGDPTSGSVGSGSANLWTFNGSSFSIDNTGLYDIINPWATTVSQDKMITAYQDINSPTKFVLVQSECEETSGGDGDGGTDPPTDPEGYCIDNQTGAVTSGVLQSACTGTWSSTEPTMGCCEINGTQNPDVAQSWCDSQSGTFNVGACPPSFDACAENARFKVTAITFNDPNPTGCATTPWNVTGISGNALGSPATGCTKVAYRGVTIASSENPPASTGVVDCDVTYNSGTGDWDLTGEVRYYNTAISGTTTVTMTGTLTGPLTGCGDTISGSIFGTSTGNYSQSCDFTDGTAISGNITLELECF